MSGHLPNVGRPKGGIWRRLQDEGIVWEGQILITGEDTDLAALLIVTNERLAFVRGGAVALDIERQWLDPAPTLRRTGTVQLWISPPNDPIAESLTFIARDGRDEAAVLLSLIGDRGAYGSAYRLPTYVPEELPPAPGFPVARSHSTPQHYDHFDYDRRAPMALYASLDDDDFPPVVASEGEMPRWEEAIAEALEPSTIIPISGSVRNPNDPLRPIEGFDSKFVRDRRSWVIRLVGLFLLVGIGSVIVSGILPGPTDFRALIDDEPTAIAVAEINSAAGTPTMSIEETTTAEPTTAPTLAGPSSSDPRDPTVVPIETAVSLGVGGDNTHIPPPPTKEPTATPGNQQQAAGDDVESAEEAETGADIEAAEEEPSPTPTTESTVVIPGPSEEDAPAETATLEPTEEATEAPTETTEPTAAEAPEATEESSAPATEPSSIDGLDLQIDEVHRGERLPDLTLGRNGTGEWVVALVEVTNLSDEPIDLAMTDIRLAPANDPTNEIPLDSASSAVASFLGMNPVVRADASAAISPGGVQPLALVFSVSVGLGDLVLLVGDGSYLLASEGIAATDTAAGFWGTSPLSFNQTFSLATGFVAESPAWPARSAFGNSLAGGLSGGAIAAGDSSLAGSGVANDSLERNSTPEERQTIHV